MTDEELAVGQALHAYMLAKAMRDGRRVSNKQNWNELIATLEGVLGLSRRIRNVER